MFCFCWQSSFLKLQALDVDARPSLGPSPEEDDAPPAPPLGSNKEQSRTPSHHGSRSEETSPAADPRPAARTPHPDGENGEGQASPGPSRLLQYITDGGSPLPSPRCPSFSQSQRFNTDPEVAPSPPCSQQFIMARGIDRNGAPGDTKDTPSIPLLTKHVQTLKRKIRKFEEKFEQEKKYMPSHNDKTANPEMSKLMSELAKSRKQLKDLKLKQSVEELKEQKKEAPTEICRYSSDLQGATELQHKPSLEETVEALLKRLKEKRQALGLPDNMKEMTQKQMALEKITLQKCLLYFESLHGRPGTRQERNLVKPLYDRYQMIKQLLCAMPTITTIEEEEGSDEDCAEQYPAPPCRASADESPAAHEEDSDTAFVSPLDEVKAVKQPTLTMSNLHEASRSELLECLRETRAEKRRRRKALREFEVQFFRQMGRAAQKEDRIPMAEEYHEYKNLKAKLRLLEVLLSKHDVSKTI
ncbi:protein FAM13C [Scleropages formosus]|uniref:protein FAM13C n=1 Tax=Scleropages formosus TaxID=113540 RepID=UPI0010FA8637|nr:protein FAM13C [Scleropages formosus]